MEDESKNLALKRLFSGQSDNHIDRYSHIHGFEKVTFLNSPKPKSQMQMPKFKKKSFSIKISQKLWGSIDDYDFQPKPREYGIVLDTLYIRGFR